MNAVLNEPVVARRHLLIILLVEMLLDEVCIIMHCAGADDSGLSLESVSHLLECLPVLFVLSNCDRLHGAFKFLVHELRQEAAVDDLAAPIEPKALFMIQWSARAEPMMLDRLGSLV